MADNNITQTIVGSAIGVIATLAGVGGKAFLDHLAIKRKQSAIRRDLRIALGSFQVAMRVAAQRGMADPQKWEPLIGRIERRMSDIETLTAVSDEQAIVVEELVRESRVAQTQIAIWGEEMNRRMKEEPELVQTESMRMAELINGERYDPRTAQFRDGVKRFGRPLDETLSRARVLFGDHSGLIGDEKLNYRKLVARSWFDRLFFPKRET